MSDYFTYDEIKGSMKNIMDALFKNMTELCQTKRQLADFQAKEDRRLARRARRHASRMTNQNSLVRA